MKQITIKSKAVSSVPAAFRRLCVETVEIIAQIFFRHQPPSGGCVLKRFVPLGTTLLDSPAAFRRLCVETLLPMFFSRE